MLPPVMDERPGSRRRTNRARDVRPGTTECSSARQRTRHRARSARERGDLPDVQIQETRSKRPAEIVAERGRQSALVASTEDLKRQRREQQPRAIHFQVSGELTDGDAGSRR